MRLAIGTTVFRAGLVLTAMLNAPLPFATPAAGKGNSSQPSPGGEPPRPLRLQASATIVSLAFAPDNATLLTRSDDRTITLWELASGKARYTIKVPEGKWWSATSVPVVFTPDGQAFASSCGDSPYALWATRTGKQLYCLSVKAVICSLAISEDAQRVAAENELGVVTIWDLQRRQLLRQLKTQPEALSVAWGGPTSGLTGRLAFSPDNRTLAVAAGNQEIQLWDLAGGKETGHLNYHSLGLRSVSFSRDGLVLASCGWPPARRRGGSIAAPIHLWKAGSEKPLLLCEGHSHDVFAVVFSRDGKTLASASADGTIRLWERATGKELTRFQDKNQSVYAVAFSPDGKRLAAGMEGGAVVVWPTLPAGWVPPDRPLTPKELVASWADLAADQASLAYRALHTLSQSPQQTVPFLQAHLKPVPVVPAERIHQLILELGHDRFATREKATATLARLGRQAGVQMRKALLDTTWQRSLWRPHGFPPPDRNHSTSTTKIPAPPRT